MYRFTLTEARPSHARSLVGLTLLAAALGAAALAVGCGSRTPRTSGTTSASLPTTTSAAVPVPVTPPAPTASHYRLAVSAWRNGDRDSAVTEFRAAIAEDSSQLPPRLNLSRVLLEQGKGGEAKTEIESVLAIDSSSGSAYRLLGRAYDVLGRPDSAVAAYHHAIVLNDQDGWSMNNLALVELERGNVAEGLRAAARAVELANSATFRNTLGVALERTGHYAAAAEAYRSAVSTDSTYHRAGANLTRVSALADSTGTPAVDLAAEALDFMREIEGWKRLCPPCSPA